MDGTAAPDVFAIVEPDPPGLPSADSARFNEASGISQPAVVEKPNPSYPEQACADTIMGTVVLDLVIDTEGTVLDIHTLESPHPLLERAATRSDCGASSLRAAPTAGRCRCCTWSLSSSVSSTVLRRGDGPPVPRSPDGVRSREPLPGRTSFAADGRSWYSRGSRHPLETPQPEEEDAMNGPEARWDARSLSRRTPVTAVVGVLALLLAAGAGGQEVTVQNDTVTDFGNATIQAGFVADESAAAWLTSPCAGDILRVQILWLSVTGGAPDTLGDSIRVFGAGAFPVPGAELSSLIGPILADGYFNEFTLDAPVPVDQGETFVVSFRFYESPPPQGPSVVTDTDGCQAGKNGIYAMPPGSWYNACALGVTGDFAIRAVVQCSSPVQYSLTVSTVGTGSGNVTSTPGGIDCGSTGSDCQQAFNSGTQVELLPTPDAGSVSAGFRGTGPACSNGYGVVEMNADRSCVCEFALQSQLIFRDGFEYGDTSGWSEVLP